MILSAQFWPSLKEEKLEVPESIKQAMEKYTKSYEVRMPYCLLGEFSGRGGEESIKQAIEKYTKSYKVCKHVCHTVFGGGGAGCLYSEVNIMLIHKTLKVDLYYSVINTKLAGLFTSWIDKEKLVRSWTQYKCCRCSVCVFVCVLEWDYLCLLIKKSLTIPVYFVIIKV